MSAYIVEYETIQKIVAFGMRQEYGSTPYYYWRRKTRYMEADRIGSVLLKENTRSVNHRYEEHTPADKYTHRPLRRAITPVEVIKACNCLDYQSCETKGWKRSEAYAILNAIRERAIRELPGYEQAEWG